MREKLGGADLKVHIDIVKRLAKKLVGPRGPVDVQGLIQEVYRRLDRNQETYEGKNRLEDPNAKRIRAFDSRKVRETTRQVLKEKGIPQSAKLVEFIHDHFSHPLGKNPGDCWSIPTKPFPEAHFAVFSPDICVRPIKSSCPPGGIVLDPMCGSGTTLVMAKKLGRRFIGIDINSQYCEMAERRLASVPVYAKLDEFMS